MPDGSRSQLESLTLGETDDQQDRNMPQLGLFCE